MNFELEASAMLGQQYMYINYCMKWNDMKISKIQEVLFV